MGSGESEHCGYHPTRTWSAKVLPEPGRRVRTARTRPTRAAGLGGGTGGKALGSRAGKEAARVVEAWAASTQPGRCPVGERNVFWITRPGRRPGWSLGETGRAIVGVDLGDGRLRREGLKQ